MTSPSAFNAGRPKGTARKELSSGSITSPAQGDIVKVVYWDHVLFRDSDSSHFQPWKRECVGWLDYYDDNYLRLVWERFAELDTSGNSRTRSSGLTILKSTVVEMSRVG